MSNTKEKMKHLPINLFLSLGSFGISFSVFSTIQDDNCLSFLIAFVMYINNVTTDSRIDYLNEKVKELKSKNGS